MRSKFKLTTELVLVTVWHSLLYKIFMEKGKFEEWRKIKAELFKKGRRCSYVVLTRASSRLTSSESMTMKGCICVYIN